MAPEGLLVQEPYRGLRVAALDSAAIMDLANTRIALDMLPIAAILEEAPGRRMSMVEVGWAKYSKVEMDPDPVIRHESHVAFHRSLWAASENALLLRLCPVTDPS